MKLQLLASLILYYHLLPICYCDSSRPNAVKIGAIFSFNSTIGRVAKVAIDAAVHDVNANPRLLPGTKLLVQVQDSNCSGFTGIVQALQFMERETVAIIGPQSSVIAHVISHVANELQVPLLSFAATDPTLSSLQYPFFIRTTLNDLFQMDAISEIVDYYQWRQVIAIYIDDDYGRNGVASLGDKLAEKRSTIACKAPLRPGASNSEIMDLLVKVELKSSRVIVLHVSPDVGLTVFAVAKGLGMLSHDYVWIATDWLSSFLDSSAPLDSSVMDTMQGALVLRQHVPDSVYKNALSARWSELIKKEKNEKFRLNSYGLYAYDTVFLVANALDAFFNIGGRISFSNDSSLHDVQGGSLHLEAMSVFDGGKLLLDQVLKTKFHGVTGLVQFDSERNLIQPSYDILNVLGTGLHTIGYWSNNSGLSIVPPEKLDTVQANHSSTSKHLGIVIWPGEQIEKPRGWVFANNGRELRIGVPSRVGYREFVSKMPSSDMMKGYCVDVFSAAINLLPYPVSYKLIPFGDDRENPSYTKLIEMVASNEFDAAVGDIAIVTNRTKIVDFTQPYIESGLVILTAVKKRKYNAWAFLQPFTLGMWCVIGISFLTVGIVIWIFEHRINDEFRGPPKKQLGTVFWFSFSTLFFAHKENTVSALGRGVLLVWLFVVLIIQSSYTASLTSLLTVQQLSSHIKGIESLRSNDEPIGFQVGSFTENYLVEVLSISRSRLKALSNPEEYARALELGPQNGGVAAVVDESPYIKLFLSKHCNFAVVGAEFTKSGWGFAFPRDSPLAVDMSTAILALSENGDLQRIHDKWLTRSLCSFQNSDIGSNQLPLASFWGLFLICGVVCTLSLLTHFAIMLRQYARHSTYDVSESSREGSGQSGRSLQRFLSFIDQREEEIKKRYNMRMMQQKASTDLNI